MNSSQIFHKLYGSDHDSYGLPNICCLKGGEQLNLDLQFLTKQGLTSTVTLTAQKVKQSLLQQIQQYFDTMTARADYQFPEIEVVDINLPLDAEVRESRLAFSRMVFPVIKVGNFCGIGLSLTINNSLTLGSFTYDALKTCFHRNLMKQPFDTFINGILYLCKQLDSIFPTNTN